MRARADAVEIPFFIPPMPDGASNHVISKGKKTDFYQPEDLKDTGAGHTNWVQSFETMFLGLFWALGEAVPYCFSTPDGAVRSLDAGCLKMLLNRKFPNIELILDSSGYIDRVAPTEHLLKQHAVMKTIWMNKIIGCEANG
ncbi:hypothetical protein KBW81_12810 [Loktanella salsilacus]|uniref:hypothetical protein n=1 Tax=Loktanella salsilacus TaxID=195913 RepID=UPI0020B8DDEB|nr:hypothetical protein [Loktanella salsilacus]UTH47587.1 hypothetical protein KBW81_12810 [Loktanella salsilacus]